MNVIEITELTKYYGKTRGVENLSLEVNDGEVFGFIGPNGAGKSTTISTLLGLLRPNRGTATIFGKDVRTTPAILRRVGYLPAEVAYYDRMRVRDLLSYSARYYRLRKTEWMDSLVERLELDLNKRIDDLSTGNRKKVAIVQSMLHQPELLVLDEPTMGLDPLMQERFFELIEEEADRGTTILFSSHILSEVERICGRVAVVKDGRVMETATVDELRSRHFLRVRGEFKKHTTVDDLRVPGIISSTTYEGLFEMKFGGDINDLLSSLRGQELTHLTVTDPSLEEVFLHYYEK